MKYDFSRCVAEADAEKVYPKLFTDLYADIKDILAIDTADQMYRFINETLCMEMLDEVFHVLPPADWEFEDKIKCLVTNLLDQTRFEHKRMYHLEYKRVARKGGSIEDMNTGEIIRSLQLHMMDVSARLAEATLSVNDKRIEWNADFKDKPVPPSA